MRFFENFSRWDALRFALAVILGGACAAVIFVFEASFTFGIYLTPNKISLYKIINLLAGAFIEAISVLYSYKIFISCLFLRALSLCGCMLDRRLM